MIPLLKKHENTEDRLGGINDFDLAYAYRNLNNVSIGSACSVWKTALWQNFLTGGLAIAIGLIMWTAYQYDPFAHQSLLIAKIVLGFVGFLFCGISVLLGITSQTRGRLVLDKELRELRFYRFWFSFRPHRKLLIDDIESLSHKYICSPGDSHEPGGEYDVLVARLRDGRRCSVAIDSPQSIEYDLKQVLNI